MSDFDWSSYTRAPVVDTPSAVALARALLSAVPKSAPPQVKKAASEMRSTTEALQAAWRAAPSEKTADPRPVDTQYDNAWGALRDRLAPVAGLPADAHPNAAKASAILDRLFPSGKDFLTLPYAKQWAECDKRIATATEEGLVKGHRRAGRQAVLVRDRAAPQNVRRSARHHPGCERQGARHGAARSAPGDPALHREVPTAARGGS